MACEQWCFLARRCLVGFTLAFVLLGSSSAVAQLDSFYNYDTNAVHHLNHEHVFYTPEIMDGKIFSNREKRSVEPRPEVSMPSTPSDQTQKSQEPLIKTETGPTSNITYVTDSATNSSSPDLVAPTTSSTLKPNIAKNGKESSTIVSNPIVPSAKGPSVGAEVWANQTQWDNATANNGKSKVETKMEKTDVNKTADSQANNSTSNLTDFDDSSIPKFTDVTNNTLLQNNITKTEEDTHQYYNSTVIVDETIAKRFWVDMDNHPDSKVNDLLSKSHRRAATVKLKFDFPFYGHKVRNVTIATGGFLYTGEYVHSWLAATQYIAPLMANFDTRLSKDSFVKYADNGTAVTVEWTKVKLQDKPKAGAFTFQATLLQNGDIIFVYREMPLSAEAIEDKAHPVKVGLSDAYIMDRTVFFVRRKTIYEYHRVHFKRQDIKNNTVIYLRALPTCLEMENCTDCLTKVPEFSCKWCPELNQCSTGTFRFRQDWLEKGCEQNSIREESSCPATGPKPTTKQIDDHEHDHEHETSSDELSASVEPNRLSNEPVVSERSHSSVNMSHMGVSGIIGIIFVVSLIAAIAGWAAYAYRNPHSASGQMLIRYRPSQWTWRRGEARYTAATIHM